MEVSNDTRLVTGFFGTFFCFVRERGERVSTFDTNQISRRGNLLCAGIHTFQFIAFNMIEKRLSYNS